MNPYTLLLEDPRRRDHMTGETSHTLIYNKPVRAEVGLADMISVGTLRAVNVLERGWRHMAALTGR